MGNSLLFQKLFLKNFDQFLSLCCQNLFNVLENHINFTY